MACFKMLKSDHTIPLLTCSKTLKGSKACVLENLPFSCPDFFLISSPLTRSSHTGLCAVPPAHEGVFSPGLCTARPIPSA